jgi:bifunctional DNA-binding transcriptional regulator/antitoxin component of YhaV-PrlF toxin-antitoxin module
MKAKLQKQLAYQYKEKRQYKHVIVIPEEAVNELGWKGGQELELCIKDSKLVIEPKKVENVS